MCTDTNGLGWKVGIVLGITLGVGTSFATVNYVTILSGSAGSRPGQFGIILDETKTYSGPSTIRVLEGGKVFVCDDFNRRVVRYDKAGNDELSFGGAATFQDGTDRPHDVAELPSGGYAVLGIARSMIYQFRTDGTLNSIHPAPSDFPLEIVVDKDGRVFVDDIRNDRLALLDASFNQVADIGGPGTPVGLVIAFAVTNGGHLVISTQDDPWRLKSYAVDGAGKTSLVKETSLDGSYSGSILAPYLLRTDDYGHIYMRFYDGDTREVVVRRYNASGKVLSEYKLPPGSRPVEVDVSGGVYFGQTTSDAFRVLKVVE